MKEIWKEIIGYEGLYSISNLGRVKSEARKLVYSNGRIHYRKERILGKSHKKDVYPKATLWRDNKSKSFSIHRLVAEHFIPNKKDLPQVNHKDGVKCNNEVSNLEWCDGSNNLKHAHNTGLKSRYGGFCKRRQANG